MRHKQNSQRFSRIGSHYKATIRSLVRAVVINQRIVTTKLKAKIARRHVDKLITLGKKLDSLSARRMAFSILGDHALVKRLFVELAPMFSSKKGGYTRIIPYKRRRGDNAELVVLELSMRKEIARPTKDKASVKKEKLDVSKPQHDSKPEHKEVAPPDKERHKKEDKKAGGKSVGGFRKFFKQDRESS